MAQMLKGFIAGLTGRQPSMRAVEPAVPPAAPVDDEFKPIPVTEQEWNALVLEKRAFAEQHGKGRGPLG